jgi:hypothetical protein
MVQCGHIGLIIDYLKRQKKRFRCSFCDFGKKDFRLLQFEGDFDTIVKLEGMTA